MSTDNAKSIGIDLGTTNSVVAIKKRFTEILKNAEGDFLTPSCVTISKKRISFQRETSYVVGINALEWIKQDPKNTIVLVKRLMGRNYNDKEILKIIKNQIVQYDIKPHSKGTENSLAVILNNKEHTPEEISAQILKKLRTDAENEIKSKIEYAVITVPAYFNDKQKHATRTAAALAGLKVQRLLPEPTAAAISFGVTDMKPEESNTILVFDFGGGTFDLCILTISGGQIIEQVKGGDNWLGGEDIDKVIIDYICNLIANEYNTDNIQSLFKNQNQKSVNRFLRELKSKVEKAKIELSSRETAYIEIMGLLKGIDVNVELKRDTFDQLIKPFVDRTIQKTEQLLSNFSADLIDKILLVGGSSQIPLVISSVKNFFGSNRVLTHKRPMLAIAEGAAILAHRLSDTYECPECANIVKQSSIVCDQCKFNLEKYTIDHGVFDIVHSTAHDYYIYLENNEKHLLIEKGRPLPCQAKEVFQLIHPDQKLVHLKFVNIVNDEEESIGDLWLGINIDKNVRFQSDKPFNIEIEMSIDESNIITISSHIQELKEVKIAKNLSRGKADEKLYIMLESLLEKINTHKYNQYIVEDVLYRVVPLIEQINAIVDNETGTVNNSLYENISQSLNKIEHLAINGSSSRSMIEYAKALINNFHEILSSKGVNLLNKRIELLEESDRNGTYKQNLKAIENLEELLAKFEIANKLMQIQKAGEIMIEIEPQVGHKLFRNIRDILKNIKNKDNKNALELLDNVLPEANEILAEREHQTGYIHTDIKKRAAKI